MALTASLAVTGCAARPPRPLPPPFRFAADTFAFANETLWEYRPDPVSKEMGWSKRDPRPPFSLRCASVTRAARQFRVHARFDPAAPRADPEAYRALVARVLHGDPRLKTPADDPVVVPGYTDLRSFSRDHVALLEAELDRPFQNYWQRGNWRMIFPFTARQQHAEAERLVGEVERGETPIVHVLRFPDLTLNHVMLVYAAERTAAAVRFTLYDPNDADTPVTLTWDRGARTFVFQQTPYWPGGPVRAYEVYRDLLR